MIGDIQEEINERLSEAEDEIIKNRINYMVNKEGFVERLLQLDLFYLSKRSQKSADNIKQELVDFLMDEMDIDG